VHVKSDSPLLYERTLESWQEAGLPVHEHSADVYGELVHRVEPELRELLEVRTYYEQMWLAEGRKIHYLRTSV
jgi:tRNA (guanine-N7-)-methyltransferase